MPAQQMTSDHLNLIADRIYEGRCVPFLGAAANVSDKKRKYKGLPLGRVVAGELSKRMQFEGKDPTNLPRVALQYEIKKDRPDLITNLRKILPDEDLDPSPLLKTLAKLPFKLIVTTNYDRLLERALDDLNKGEVIRDYVTIIQTTEGIIIQPREGAGIQGPNITEELNKLEVFKGLIIYKLHGTFRDVIELGQQPEDNSPIIITEDDYIHFLTVAGMKEIGVPRLITSRITPNTLLFLGYSLEDWDFRTIHRGLVKTLSSHRKRQSFAIQKNPAEYWVKFWTEQKVDIYDIELYDFTEQMESRYFERHGKA
jgi:hypothetical protein